MTALQILIAAFAFYCVGMLLAYWLLSKFFEHSEDLHVDLSKDPKERTYEERMRIYLAEQWVKNPQTKPLFLAMTSILLWPVVIYTMVKLWIQDQIREIKYRHAEAALAKVGGSMIDLIALSKIEDASNFAGCCQDCGRGQPECGFYPLLMTSFDTSGQCLTKYSSLLLCNDCEKARREKATEYGNAS